MIITTQQILDLRPCAEWPRERIAAIVGDGITPMQIAADERISTADRRWVLTRLCDALPGGRQRLVLWAAGCAQDVAHLAPDEDAARCAISTAVAWAEGCATVEDVRARRVTKERDMDTSELRQLAQAATPGLQPADLRKLRYAAECATQGAWRNGTDPCHFDAPEVTDDKSFAYYVPDAKNAAFIAAASPSVVLSMLDALDAAVRECEVLTTRLAAIARELEQKP